jgi:DNA modification methylase
MNFIIIKPKTMKTGIVKISHLVEIPELKAYYSPQSIDEIATSIELDGGMRSPIIVTENYEIIDGYRRVDAMKVLNKEYINVLIDDVPPTVFERIIRNMYRTKTVDDQVKELKSVFEKFPKKMGQKNKEGKVYNRSEEISKSLNKKYSGKETISKLEYILNNDIENNLFTKGILEKNWKMETSHDFLTKWYPKDIENGFGFTNRLKSGEINVQEAVKLIKQKLYLENDYQDTFVIPEKGTSYNLNCIELGNIEKHFNTVDLLFSSPPYFILRNYLNEGKNQVGQEETKEKYCLRIANLIKSALPTLKQSANVIINIGETYDDGVGYGIPQLLKTTIERETGLIYKDQLIWSKPNPKPQNESVKRPINNVEYLLWFVVDPKKAFYKMLTYTIKDRISKISYGAKDVDKNGKIWDKNISLSKPYQKIYSHIKEQDIVNIIEAKTGKNTEVYSIYEEGHPAIMCGVLPVVPILMCTDEKNHNTVLDIFSGSNVVGRMSILLNRKILSTELSKDYYNIGCKMLTNAVNEFDRESLDIINDIVYEEFEEAIAA